ncbi:MAG: BlaI/MecI/CopY family transcriptional regulator, partial [Catenulispora sp.]
MALGDLEREVMTVLWERYLPITVREVHQELARERH